MKITKKPQINIINRVFRAALLLSSIGIVSGACAQSLIELSQAERTRLGIVTTDAGRADNRQGVEVSAMVISSPLEAGRVNAVYGGVLKRWLVTAGTEVTAGSKLAEIQSTRLLELQTEWKQAATVHDQLTFELEKDQQLYDEGIISERRLAATRNDYSNARFVLQSAEEALLTAGYDKASLETLENTALGIYVVRAPVDGTLAHRIAETGAMVEAGTEIAELTTAGNSWVMASVPARFSQHLIAGNELRLSTGEQVIIRQRDYAIDSMTQTFDIYAEVQDGRQMIPGEISGLIIAAASSGVWVPDSAVVHNGNDTAIYISVASGIESRTLSLVPSGSGYIAESGIQPGESVVIQGAAILKGIELGLGGGE